MAKSYDYLFKVILVGDSGTDKTGLMLKFCPPLAMHSIGIDFMVRNIELESKKIKLQIWDTACSERFRTINSSNFRGTQGIALVYDITKRATFENICKRYHYEVDNLKSKDAVVMLLGNKCHLEDSRQIRIEEGKQLAEKFGILFFETSSEENINVEQAFVTLAQAIMEKVKAKSS